MGKRKKQKITLFIMMIILSIAYMGWRIFVTTPFDVGGASIVLATVLLLVEFVNITVSYGHLAFTGEGKGMPSVRLVSEGKHTYVTFNEGKVGSIPNGLEGLVNQYKDCLVNSKIYWLRIICRFGYIIIPVIASIFGLVIFDTKFAYMIYVWAAFYFIFTLVVKGISNGYRNIRVNNFYDTGLLGNTLVPVVLEKLRLKKSSRISKKHRWGYIVPNVLLLVLSIVAVVMCLIRADKAMTSTQLVTIKNIGLYYIVILIWLIHNVYVLVITMFFLFGRKRERQLERHEIAVDALVKSDDVFFEGTTIDLTEGGISIKTGFPEYIHDDDVVEIICKAPDKDVSVRFKAKVVYTTNYGEEYKYAFCIVDIDEENKNAYKDIMYNRKPLYRKIQWVDASILGEIFTIIKKRKKKRTRNVRRLARLALYKELKTTTNRDVLLYNFSYEFMLLGHKKKQKIDREIEVIFEDGLVVKGSREYEKLSFPDTDRVVVLYQVTNIEEFIKNKNLKPLLSKWSEEYKSNISEDK